MASVTCYLILNQHFIPMTYLGQCDSYAEQSKHQLDVTCFIILLFTAERVSNVSTSIFRSLRLVVDLFISCVVK
jgi:hypothetical protein